VGVPVDNIHENVGHRLVGAIYGDPGPPTDRMGSQIGFRRWFVVCDRLHPDRTELFASRLLGLSERRTVIWARRTDSNHEHIFAHPAQSLLLVTDPATDQGRSPRLRFSHSSRAAARKSAAAVDLSTTRRARNGFSSNHSPRKW
jgi:hypothetical protein